MRIRAIHSLVPPFVALALALGATGCAVIGGSPEHVGGRATLSDAAAAANPDSSRKQRRLNVGYTVPPDQTGGIPVSGSNSYAVDDREGGPAGTGSGGATGKAGSGDISSHPVFGLVAGGGAIGGTGYDGFGEYGILIGAMIEPRWRFDLIGSVSPIQFADQTIANQSFENEFDLNLDLMGRYYLTAGHTFLGAYPLVGVRFGTLFWDYAKPVPVFEDGVRRDIKNDSINHFSMYGGFGLGLMQTRHLHVGALTMGGVRFYGWDTKNGFSNTLFAPAGFVQGRLEVALK